MLSGSCTADKPSIIKSEEEENEVLDTMANFEKNKRLTERDRKKEENDQKIRKKEEEFLLVSIEAADFLAAVKDLDHEQTPWTPAILPSSGDHAEVGHAMVAELIAEVTTRTPAILPSS